MPLTQGSQTRNGHGPPLRRSALCLGLDSYELIPGHLPEGLLGRLRDYVTSIEWDDLTVRRNGGNGPFKRKRDTNHPSADRK